MFLSKKNATYFNKPKTIDSTKPKRILGGWQDDVEEIQDKIDYNQRQLVKETPVVQNLLQAEGFKDMSSTQTQQQQQSGNSKLATKNAYYLDWDELDARQDIECEKRLIQEIVQPGGIRVKPSESQLSEFFKESKGMQVHIIGSLLLSKIEVNYPFQNKAKALYTIEYMVKKNEKYAAFFKAQSEKLRKFPEPQDNVENYKKILKSTLNSIGIQAVSQDLTAQGSEPQLTFVDPGYNDQPAKKQSDMKAFISENASKKQQSKKTENNKKAIIGPGQKKAPKGPDQGKCSTTNAFNTDLMGLDLLGGNTQNTPETGQQNSGGFNLLDEGTGIGIITDNNSNQQQQQANNNNLTFEQMMGTSKPQQQHPRKQSDLI